MRNFTKGRRRYAKGRPVKGVMNANEAAFAKVLEEWKTKGDIQSYDYEAIQLILAPRTTLLLDFYVVEADGTLAFYECKAGMKSGRYRVEEDANVKMKLAANKFPHLKIIVTWTHKNYGRKYKEIGAYGLDTDDNGALELGEA